LIDEQTSRRRRLLFPPCEKSPGLGPLLGGPWLAIGCSLYNLNSGRWTAVRVSSQCVGSCNVVGVGRYWVKIVTDEGQAVYGPTDYYLQNIRTGQFERDPATPGGTVLDDLNAPSGSRPLCSPLRYPSFNEGRSGISLGSIAFFGQFVLTFGSEPQGDVYRLRRCRSNLNRLVSSTSDTDSGFPPPQLTSSPMASPRALILGSAGYALHGLLLPSMRRFTIPICTPNDPPNDRNCVRFPIRPNYIYPSVPVAVTDQTIYVFRQAYQHPELWAAALPTPKQLTRRSRVRHR
jgi:hypothetical protein